RRWRARGAERARVRGLAGGRAGHHSRTRHAGGSGGARAARKPRVPARARYLVCRRSRSRLSCELRELERAPRIGGTRADAGSPVAHAPRKVLGLGAQRGVEDLVPRLAPEDVDPRVVARSHQLQPDAVTVWEVTAE